MSVIVYSASASFKSYLSGVINEKIQFESALDAPRETPASLYFLHVSSLGPDCFSWIKKYVPKKAIKVVVCSDQPNIAEMLDTVECGAKSYCHSYMQISHYQQLIRLVANGQSWFPPQLLETTFALAHKALHGGDTEKLLEALTRREKDVALAVTEGLSNKKIALELNISESTVKRHLSTVFKKLQLPDRVALVLHLKKS
jgi:DNA-binding NarL/FixJ family response regulator